MENYVIITESTCDATYSIAETSGINYIIPMNFSIEGKNHLDYPDHKSLPIEEFYHYLRNKKEAHTSALNPQDIVDVCEPYMEKGISVLYLVFSSGLSNTYQNSLLAARELNEKYDAQLRPVDTKTASMGQALFAYYCAQKKASGMSMEQVAVWAEENAKYVSALFTVDDLFHLKRGGRVSAATAILGSALGIKPILHVDDEGHLVSIGKVRGRKASLDDLVNRAMKTRVKQVDEKIYISHADCYEDAVYVKDQMKKNLGLKDNNFEINYIGPTIGVHAGPGTVALFFMATQR